MRILPMRRRAAIAALAAVALVALSGCSGQATVDIDVPEQVDAALPVETVSQLESAVTSAMTATGASGAIVSVSAPWSGTWVGALGTQTPGGDPVSADMSFRAADVTRAMTCDVLFRVAAEGAVSLDDPVTQYVSAVPHLDHVTLRQLCDSTSGVGSYTPQLQGMWMTNPARVWDPRELAGYGMAQSSDVEPGTTFVDSDAGYLLLGLALERAKGTSIQALIRDYVAEPLALPATLLPSGDAAPPAGAAALAGHWSVADAAGVWNCATPLDITTLSASVGGSDSGAVTNIADLSRYAQALATGALAGEQSGRFDAPLPVAADAPSWFTAAGGAYLAGSLVGQFGSVPGYLTAAFADPATGMSVAVVLNNSGANASIGAWLAWELAAIASKAPAAAGQTAPQAGLPWTAQQFHDQIAANAICAAPAP